VNASWSRDCAPPCSSKKAKVRRRETIDAKQHEDEEAANDRVKKNMDYLHPPSMKYRQKSSDELDPAKNSDESDFTIEIALIFAAFVAGLVYLRVTTADISSGPPRSTISSAYESYQRSSSPGAALTKRCASEAGIPANDPQHRITPEEMRRLMSCVNRNL